MYQTQPLQTNTSQIVVPYSKRNLASSSTITGSSSILARVRGVNGNVISGKGKPPVEFHLHVGIYKVRPDIKAIVHAHPKWSVFLTMTGHDYQPVYAQGALVYRYLC